MFRSINFRPALLWFSISFLFVCALGAISIASTFSPALEQKLESMHYRVLEMLPPPPHTEFVPTPLPIRAVARAQEQTATGQFIGPVLSPTVGPGEFVGPVLPPTPTAAPTDAPTEVPTARPTLAPARPFTP